MAEEMTLKPHQVLRLVQLDRRQRVFENESIWLCLTCETCTARCPNGFDPARAIDGLREMVLSLSPEAVPRRIRAFHESFLDQIRSHGRLFEMGLILSYKMKTGALFDDVGSAPAMLARGKLKFFPQTIHGIDEVRRIFDACQNHEGEES
jgi:heterodisulfide reductase subunit C